MLIMLPTDQDFAFEVQSRWHGTTTRIPCAVLAQSPCRTSRFLLSSRTTPRVDTVDDSSYHPGFGTAPMRRILFLSAAFSASMLIPLNSSLTPLTASAQRDLEPRGYVSDFAEVLSASTKDQLAALCAEVDQKAHAQIVVSTVASLDGRSIVDFSIDLATQRGLGPAQSERGVLILLAVEDRQYRFEVGRGLEPVLPDSKTASFGREAMPYLLQANYDAALLLMSRRVADVIAQDRGITLTTPQPVPPPRRLLSEQEEKDYMRVALVLGALCLLILFYAAVRRALRMVSRN